MSAGKLGGTPTNQAPSNDGLMGFLFGSDYQSLFGGPAKSAAPAAPAQPAFQTPGFAPPQANIPGSMDISMPTMPSMPDFGSFDTMFNKAQQNIAQPTFGAPSAGPQMTMYEGPRRTFSDEPLIPAAQYQQQTPQQPRMAVQPQQPRSSFAPQPQPQQRMPAPRPTAPARPGPVQQFGQRVTSGAINKGAQSVVGGASKALGGAFGSMGGGGGGAYGDYTGGQEMGPSYEEMGYYPEEGLYGGDADAQEGGFYGGGTAPQAPVDEWADWGGVEEFTTPSYNLDVNEMDWSSYQPSYDLSSFDSPNFGYDFGDSFNFDSDFSFGDSFDFGGDWDW